MFPWCFSSRRGPPRRSTGLPAVPSAPHGCPTPPCRRLPPRAVACRAVLGADPVSLALKFGGVGARCMAPPRARGPAASCGAARGGPCASMPLACPRPRPCASSLNPLFTLPQVPPRRSARSPARRAADKPAAVATGVEALALTQGRAARLAVCRPASPVRRFVADHGKMVGLRLYGAGLNTAGNSQVGARPQLFGLRPAHARARVALTLSAKRSTASRRTNVQVRKRPRP